MFIAGACLATLNCFEKADYNLPIYILAYLLWDAASLKVLINFIQFLKIKKIQFQV